MKSSEAEGGYRPIIPLILGGAFMMQSINSTFVINALPAMAKELGHSPLDLNVTITAYLLASAVFLPLSGWAADRFGTRTAFLVSIVAFVTSSILCGLAQTLPQLIGARLLGGAAAALMTPVGRLVLLRTAPKRELVQAMSFLTMPLLIGPVIGPPLGGAILAFASWRWIFFVNAPIAVAAIILVLRFIPEIRAETRTRLDFRGFVLSGCGLAGLLFGLQNLGHAGVPPGVLAGILAGGLFSCVLYYFHARGRSESLLDFSVLRVRTFYAAVVGGQFIRIMNGATPFLLTLLLQVGFGLSALAAGLMTFASAAAALAMKSVAPPIIRRFGFRTVLLVNTGVIVATFCGYALFTPSTSRAAIVGLLFLGGFFRSLQFTSLNTLAYVDLSPAEMSGGSTLLSMSQPLAQSLGIALAAGVVHVSSQFLGGGVSAAAIAPAFVIVGLVPLLGLPFFWRMARDAGSEASGHRAVG